MPSLSILPQPQKPPLRHRKNYPMPSYKNQRIAAQFGVATGVELEAWLADPRLTVAIIAGRLGTSPAHLANLLAAPAPVQPVVIATHNS